MPVSVRPVSALAFHGRAEQRRLIGLAGDPGGGDVSLHLELEVVAGRHDMDLAAFLAEVKPPLGPVRVVIADLELGDGPGAGGGVFPLGPTCRDKMYR